MKDYRADFRDAYNHPDIVVPMVPNLEFGARSILAYFAEQIRQGTTFRAGETVQVGWMIVMLKANEGGDLEIWEPEFKSMPISWVRGANDTYRHLMVQKEVCSQIGVEPTFPTLRQSAIVSTEFLDSHELRMTRAAPEDTKSGWTFTGGGKTCTGGGVRSLFEIAIGHPEAIPFLALPAGASANCTNGNIQINFGASTVSSDSNEFLRRLVK